MKKMLIAGNWKMNNDIKESELLANQIIDGINNTVNIDILICPPFVALERVNNVIVNSIVKLGAQNCWYEPKGAFTGEISIPMLYSAGCKYIIIGHSERRTYFFENDEILSKKVNAIIDFGLNPILCIGETYEQRQNAQTFDIIETQLKTSLKDLNKLSDFNRINNLIIAYEPVWAIGTGLAATPEQVQEAHAFIRKILTELIGNTAESIPILYGGSVTKSNAKELLELKDVNGALIGGASLNAESFLSIIYTANSIINS